MSSEKTLITVDALGADRAPGVVLDGVKLALSADPNLAVELAGPEDVVVPFCEKLNTELAEHNDSSNGEKRCKPLIAPEEITMGEHPARAVRKKRKSSIVLGCKSVSDGESQGFFSGGNTGACLAAATLYTGRIQGVKRPMLAVHLPSVRPDKKTLFCDVGANADCKPEYLLQFGQIAEAILRVGGVKNPKVALLNIGEEDEKGSSLTLAANELMRKNLKSFAGNAQGSDLLTGEFDAIIAGGEAGNIALKTLEGTTKSLFEMIKQTMMSSLKTKIGALLLKSALKDMIKKLDPESVGAALLFGVKGIVCVGHGSSSEKAICSGILRTAEFARMNYVQEIENLKLDKQDVKSE
ncbi:MAG: phosphate acyltransferase PlsX [Coriobacteriia bacterium]|nr:phosphate acyltransferase PlsX [Coriobacteriia bacterium]